MARLNIPPATIIEGSQPDLRRFVWAALPDNLQEVMSPHKPVYKLHSRIVVEFNGYRITALPGAFTDLSSVPLWARIFGSHRFTKNALWDCPAVIHDLLCWGVDQFVEDARENIKLADQCYTACGIANGIDRWRAKVRYYALRLVGTFKYKKVIDHAPVLLVERIEE